MTESLWHTVELELTENVPIQTTVRFAEPGSGFVHEQQVPSYIPQGVKFTARVKFDLKGEG